MATHNFREKVSILGYKDDSDMQMQRLKEPLIPNKEKVSHKHERLLRKRKGSGWCHQMCIFFWLLIKH